MYFPAENMNISLPIDVVYSCESKILYLNVRER